MHPTSSPPISQTAAQRAAQPHSEITKSKGSEASLHDARHDIPDRSMLRRAIAFLGLGAARFVPPVSTKELAHRMRPTRGYSDQTPVDDTPVDPATATQTVSEQQQTLTDKLLRLFAAGCSAFESLVRFLSPKTSVVYTQRRVLSPLHSAVEAPTAHQPLLEPAHSFIHPLCELAPPEDHGTGALGAALEKVALEIRSERAKERRHEESRAQDEVHRKRARAKDAVYARDLQNGIRNPATEDIIDQLEGPFAMSVDTALARVDDLNRNEKS